jgi:hypothetical protein
VLEHARNVNQTIVTTNHDMIVLCAEEEESVIWLTPRDKDISLEALVGMCFSQLREWQRLLDDTSEPVCIMAHKTKCMSVPLDRAKRVALERGKRRRRRERAKARRDAPGELLLSVESDDAAPA